MNRNELKTRCKKKHPFSVRLSLMNTILQKKRDRQPECCVLSDNWLHLFHCSHKKLSIYKCEYGSLHSECSLLNVLVMCRRGKYISCCSFFFSPSLFLCTVITDWSDVIMILHRFCAMYVRSSWLSLLCWCVMMWCESLQDVNTSLQINP